MNINAIKSEVQERFQTLPDGLQTQIAIWAEGLIARAIKEEQATVSEDRTPAKAKPKKSLFKGDVAE